MVDGVAIAIQNDGPVGTHRLYVNAVKTKVIGAAHGAAGGDGEMRAAFSNRSQSGHDDGVDHMGCVEQGSIQVARKQLDHSFSLFQGPLYVSYVAAGVLHQRLLRAHASRNVSRLARG